MFAHLLASVAMVFVCLGISLLAPGGGERRSLDQAFFRGLVIVAGLLAWTHLFLPISWKLLPAMFLLSGLGFWRRSLRLKAILGEPAKSWVRPGLPALGIGLFCLALSAHRPESYDTHLYHLQSVFWRQQFPVIPGLGNLHGRLALHSSGFGLSALFSHLPRVSYPLFPLLYFFLMLRLWSGLQSRGDLRNLLVFGILFGLVFLNDTFAAMMSPAPDALALFTVVYIALLARAPKIRGDGALAGDLILFAIFAFTVKLSLVFLPVLSVYLVWKRPGRLRECLSWGMFLLLPFFLENLIQSGHPLFPSLALSGLHFDWSVPEAAVLDMTAWIESWARRPGADPAYVLSLPFHEWFPVWFQNLSRKERFILSAFMLSLPRLWVHFKRVPEERQVLMIVLHLSLGLWIFTAPDFRFSYGFFAASLVLWVDAFFPDRLSIPVPRPLVKGLSLAAVLVLFFAYRESVGQGLRAPLWPVGAEKVSVTVKMINNIPFYQPVGDDRCSATPLPCAPSIPKGLRMRGSTLAEGLRVVE